MEVPRNESGSPSMQHTEIQPLRFPGVDITVALTLSGVEQGTATRRTFQLSIVPDQGDAIIVKVDAPFLMTATPPNDRVEAIMPPALNPYARLQTNHPTRLW